MLGSGISRIMGHGDYAVKSNTCINGPPSFAALNQGIRIRHREYISDVSSTTAFSSTTYAIQPTNSVTFPWLSQIAGSFEQYKIHGMVFTYNTTAGSAISSTNNALGVIGMTTCYDPSQSAFVNKRQCEDYVGCVSGVPSANLMHAVECAPKSDVLERYYCLQNNSLPEDLKFYNHGTLNLFSQGSQATTVVGELWISYDIEFYNPRLENSGYDSSADHIYQANYTLGNVNPLGSAVVTARPGSNIGSFLSASTITLPNNSVPGIYFVQIVLNSTGITSGSALSFSTSSNIAAYSMLYNDTTASQTISSTNLLSYTLFFIKSNSNGGTVTFTGSGLTAQTAQVDIVVAALPQNLVTGLPSLAATMNQNIKLAPAINEAIRSLMGEDLYNKYSMKTAPAQPNLIMGAPLRDASAGRDTDKSLTVPAKPLLTREELIQRYFKDVSYEELEQ